jgi:hypothetical protein
MQLNEMYIVELIDKSENVVAYGMIERGNVLTWVAASPKSLQYCSKFHSKDKAQTVATKIEKRYRFMKDDNVRARVASEYGSPTVQGSKQGMPEPQKDKVRR